MTPLETLRHHVTGAIERGEKEAITEVTDRTISVGTLVEGTYAASGLLLAFGQELARIHRGTWREDVDEAMTYVRDPNAWRERFLPLYGDGADEGESLAMLVTSLIEALNEAANEVGLWFGANPGDGADFGYWKDEADS